MDHSGHHARFGDICFPGGENGASCIVTKVSFDHYRYILALRGADAGNFDGASIFKLRVVAKTLTHICFCFTGRSFFSMLITSLFLAVDDIRRGATWIIVRIFRNPEAGALTAEEKISRSAFFSWLGLGLGGGLFGTLIYGFSNKYNYTIRRQHLQFSNLPASFKGLRSYISPIFIPAALWIRKPFRKALIKYSMKNPTSFYLRVILLMTRQRKW
jgi:hypothetical protein